MRHTFKPQGVCSKQIDFDIENGRLHNISFTGGCNGNLQGVARLAEGRTVDEVIALLAGIHCGDKSTSCPDQFAKALQAALE